MLSCFYPTKEEIDSIKNEIELLGIPIFIAPYDGEIMAAKMSRQQLLFGVWTVDTDTYPVGSLTTITGISRESNNNELMVDAVITPIILDSLNITREQLVDYCIMHGTDFNDRIKGIGPEKIYTLMINNDWNIDNIKKNKPDLNLDILNYKLVREIFEGPNVDNITMKDLTINSEKWLEHLRTKPFDIIIPPNPKLVDII